MKKILIVVVVLFTITSCKKENKTDCYLCELKNGSTLLSTETRCSPQPSTSIEKDSSGNDITVVCKLKN